MFLEIRDVCSSWTCLEVGHHQTSLAVQSVIDVEPEEMEKQTSWMTGKRMECDEGSKTGGDFDAKIGQP